LFPGWQHPEPDLSEETVSDIFIGDCREILPTLGRRVQTCITSPPYFGLRDYGVEKQIGLEQTPAEYIASLVEVFRLVRDLLADDGTLWLNLGDTYAGSWGNYGGVNRGAGKQRAIVSGSRAPNAAWDERTKFKPPAANGFPGIKPKDLIGIPWRVAFALQEDGWYLRSDIIWSKPNPMPESVTDRPTKAHEYIFLLTKSAEYFYDADAIREDCLKTGTAKHLLGGDGARAGNRNGLRPSVKRGGFHGKTLGIPGREAFRASLEERNKRSVWTVPVTPYLGAHFATFPPELILPCVLAGSRPGDFVLDPFMGSGTTALVAKENGRRYLGCELNPAYASLQVDRLRQEVLFAAEEPA
jgi:DNA modification methylase